MTGGESAGRSRGRQWTLGDEIATLRGSAFPEPGCPEADSRTGEYPSGQRGLTVNQIGTGESLGNSEGFDPARSTGAAAVAAIRALPEDERKRVGRVIAAVVDSRI